MLRGPAVVACVARDEGWAQELHVAIPLGSSHKAHSLPGPEEFSILSLSFAKLCPFFSYTPNFPPHFVTTEARSQSVLGKAGECSHNCNVKM